MDNWRIKERLKKESNFTRRILGPSVMDIGTTKDFTVTVNIPDINVEHFSLMSRMMEANRYIHIDTYIRVHRSRLQ